MNREEILADGVRLILGDCREVLPTLGPVGVVLTDPPFGIDYQSGHATEKLWRGGFRIAHDKCTTVRDEALQLVSAPALVFGSRKAPEPPGTRMVLIWDKGPALGMGALDLPWKPSYEEIYVIGKGFHGYRGGGVIYHHPTQAMASNGRVHPNEKPVGLLQLLLQKCPSGTVLDMFMGSGSAGVAAIKEGRPFTGIEIEPAYFETARRRMSEALAAPSFFIPRPASAQQEALL
jgi:hypothetical protein